MTDAPATTTNSWTDSFAATNTDDLVTSSCLVYADLSTWDLRGMSYENKGDVNTGYYFASDSNGKLIFNPC